MGSLILKAYQNQFAIDCWVWGYSLVSFRQFKHFYVWTPKGQGIILLETKTLIMFQIHFKCTEQLFVTHHDQVLRSGKTTIHLKPHRPCLAQPCRIPTTPKAQLIFINSKYPQNKQITNYIIVLGPYYARLALWLHGWSQNYPTDPEVTAVHLTLPSSWHGLWPSVVPWPSEGD